MGTTSRFFGVTTGFCISNLVLVVLNRLSAIYANRCQHTAHAKARFTPVGVNVQAATFSASTFEIWNSRERKV